MVDDASGIGAPAAGRTREIGTSVLTLGGLAAAFGAASCCALPMTLGLVGLGSGWLFQVALVAGPYQSALLWIALVCVGVGLALAHWRRPAVVCATGGCTSWSLWATRGGLWLATALIGGAMVFG